MDKNNSGLKYKVGDKVALNGNGYDKENIDYYNKVATIKTIYKANYLYEEESYEILFEDGAISIVFSDEINLVD